MFLMQLHSEQKYAFMTLARNLVAADNVFTPDEQAMMEQYRQEMGLENDGDVSSEQAIACFSSATGNIQKKIMFELLALAYADTNYSSEEQMYLKKLLTAFGLHEDFLVSARDVLSALDDVYKRLAVLLDA